MRELPFFKFNPSKYLSGDITMCSLEAQGLFINILCFYWMKGCVMTKASLKARFSQADATLTELFEHGVIKVVDGDERIEIDFLKTQRVEFEERHEILSNAGRAGGSKMKARLKAGLVTTKALIKPPLSNKEEDKIRDKIRDTIGDFGMTVLESSKKINESLPSKNARDILELHALLKKNMMKDSIPENEAHDKSSELLKSDCERYLNFMNWIDNNAPTVNKLKEPFTVGQYIEIKKKYPDGDKLKKLITSLDNWSPLLKKRSRAYGTAINWKID